MRARELAAATSSSISRLPASGPLTPVNTSPGLPGKLCPGAQIPGSTPRETHPEVSNTSMGDSSKLPVTGSGKAGAFATAGAQQAPTVMAQGLDNPRGLAFAPNGDLYVAEAGSGGDGACTFSPPNPRSSP